MIGYDKFSAPPDLIPGYASGLDTLPTQANLKQWGKTSSDLCKARLRADPPLQGSRRETLQHVLNLCKVSLNLGKFTWRHDNTVRYICQSIDPSKCTLYADNTPGPYHGDIKPTRHCDYL